MKTWMIPWKYLNLLKNLVYQYKVLETIEDETKEQKGEFFGVSLGTLADTLLGNM